MTTSIVRTLFLVGLVVVMFMTCRGLFIQLETTAAEIREQFAHRSLMEE